MNIHMRALSRLFGFFRTSGRRSGVAIASAVLLVPLLTAPVSLAADACQPGANAIVCENSKPGTDPEIWDIWGAGDDSIQGFSTDISVNVGGRIDFKIDTDASAYTIDIYRTGWYQGLGARKVASVQPSVPLPQRQPECLTDVATELTDCGTWSVSASWTVPQSAVSGVYLAKLTRNDTGGGSHITFVVRNDSSTSDVLFQTSDPTWQAYNSYGGSDFYQGAANGRAYKISYNRPFATRAGVEARDFYFGAEYPLVRFMERNGYDVSYFSGVDTDRHGELLKNHNVFLSVGHDEYWSGAQRANVEAARDAGVNLQFLTGNEVYWRTRYEPSSTDPNTNYRTLVSYKETWSNAKIDPNPEWTGTWRDPRFVAPDKGGGRPENELTGTAYLVNHGDLPVTVNSREGKLRLWRNTGLEALPTGSSAELAPHTVGYESNEILDNGFRPAGQFLLSTTTGAVPQVLQDFGNNILPGETTHHLTMYKATSGALVFSAGSIQWTWGLDQTHDGDGAPADPRMQQAQLNLFADMGALPTTLMNGMDMPVPSTDKIAPVVNITSGPSGNVPHGALTEVKGTATDAEGVVAAVEYSADGGKTWKAATGTSAWSFTYAQQGIGDSVLLVRGIDDSGNYPATPASIPLNVKGPYSVFGETTPQSPDSGDGSSVELGLRFTPTIDGHVTGVRFYKSNANLGTHTGSLWSLNGTRLAKVTFSQETASGWQEAVFDESVPVAAGTEYIVSYSAPKGRYSGDNWFYAYRGLDRQPLAVAGGFGVPSAGVYDTAGGFPASSYQQGNYYVDALFQPMDAVPLRANAHSPQDTAVSVPTSTPIAATLSKPVDASSVRIAVTASDGTVLVGTTAYDAATRRAVFNPDGQMLEGTRYEASITATDSAGNNVTAGGTWSFRTVLPQPAPGECPCSVYADSEVPAIGHIDDGSVLTLGTRFSADTSGKLLGLKFYRDATNPGPHVGRLYATDGSKLAEVTFGTESASGWQYAKFAEPIPITAGTQYVASYTTTGPYSATAGAFAVAHDFGPLHTRWESGQFSYSDGYPSATTSTSYLVDVAFEPDATQLSLLRRSPGPGSVDVAPDAAVSATFNRPLAPGYSMEVTGSTAGAIAGDFALSDDAKTLSFTPDSPLPFGETITINVRGLVSTEGSTLEPASWSFSTLAQDGSPSSFLGTAVPESLDPNDYSPIELGLRLSTSRDIDVKAIRYFRGSDAAGVHTGSLWSSGGQRLATVTFPAATASGWQTATLDAPVRLAAGQTFTVSYFAPQGGYVSTAGALEAPKSSGPLSLAGSNGVYRYGDGSAMPDASWNATNYFADLIYSVAGDPVPSGTPSPTAGSSAPASTAPAGQSPTPDPDSSAPNPTPTASASTDPSASVSSGPPPELPDGSTTILGMPAVDAAVTDDRSSVELALAFSTTTALTARGVAFYKSTENSGLHTGYLYGPDGSLLASVQFAAESASGWQIAEFSDPVPLPPGNYTVSYLAPHGGYNFMPATDWLAVAAGDAVPSQWNGRFLYGTGGTVPTGSWNSTNYFVDLVHSSD